VLVAHGDHDGGVLDPLRKRVDKRVYASHPTES
jgi:hypothetical protein